eukprot:1160418-Amphidinium_carterae.2
MDAPVPQMMIQRRVGSRAKSCGCRFIVCPNALSKLQSQAAELAKAIGKRSSSASTPKSLQPQKLSGPNRPQELVNMASHTPSGKSQARTFVTALTVMRAPSSDASTTSQTPASTMQQSLRNASILREFMELLAFVRFVRVDLPWLDNVSMIICALGAWCKMWRRPIDKSLCPRHSSVLGFSATGIVSLTVWPSTNSVHRASARLAVDAHASQKFWVTHPSTRCEALQRLRVDCVVIFQFLP